MSAMARPRNRNRSRQHHAVNIIGDDANASQPQDNINDDTLPQRTSELAAEQTDKNKESTNVADEDAGQMSPKRAAKGLRFASQRFEFKKKYRVARVRQYAGKATGRCWEKDDNEGIIDHEPVLNQLLHWTSPDSKGDDKSWEDLRAKELTPEWDFYAKRSPNVALVPAVFEKLWVPRYCQQRAGQSRTTTDDNIWKFHFSLCRALGYLYPLPTFSSRPHSCTVPPGHFSRRKLPCKPKRHEELTAKRKHIGERNPGIYKRPRDPSSSTDSKIANQSSKYKLSFQENGHTGLIFHFLQSTMLQEILESNRIQQSMIAVVSTMRGQNALDPVTSVSAVNAIALSELELECLRGTEFLATSPDFFGVPGYVEKHRQIMRWREDHELLETVGYPSYPLLAKIDCYIGFYLSLSETSDDEEKTVTDPLDENSHDGWYELPRQIKLWYWSRYFNHLRIMNITATAWKRQFLGRFKKGKKSNVTRGQISQFRRKQASKEKRRKNVSADGCPGDEFFNMFADHLTHLDEVIVNHKLTYSQDKGIQKDKKKVEHETITVFPHGPTVQRIVSTMSIPLDSISTSFVQLTSSPTSTPLLWIENPNFSQSIESLILILPQHATSELRIVEVD